MMPADMKKDMKSLVVRGIVLSLVAGLCFSGCGGTGFGAGKPVPILRDAFSFYVLDPGVFQIIGPEQPTEKLFLLLEAGDVEIECARFRGAFLASGAPDADLEMFARVTVEDYQWMPGCRRWLLDGGVYKIGEQWYYVTTLLVRRDPRLSENLTPIQRTRHAGELQRFPDNEDRIVKLFHTFRDRNIYIITVSGPPEAMAAREADLELFLANVRTDPAQALAITGESTQTSGAQ